MWVRTIKKRIMEITYSKQREPSRKPPYINFRMRKLIFARMFELTNDKVVSQKIADECETITTANFWIKRKDVNDSIKQNKAA